MARSCLSIADINDSDVSRLFFAARKFKTEGFSQHQHRFSVVTLFLEPSTRTRMSFQMAAYKLNGTCFDFDKDTSSLKKGESLEATIENIACLNPDLLIMRQSETLDRDFLAGIDIPVINAGDGMNEHPTQALLDCFTLCETFRAKDLQGKKILFVGDLMRSRVFNSNVKLLKRMGAQVATIGSASQPVDKIYPSFDVIDQEFDAVMVLRKQKERALASTHEIFTECLTGEHLARLGQSCFLLHPGPVMLKEDIEPTLFSHERTLILEQVRNGLFIRAALLQHCLGG